MKFFFNSQTFKIIRFKELRWISEDTQCCNGIISRLRFPMWYHESHFK